MVYFLIWELLWVAREDLSRRVLNDNNVGNNCDGNNAWQKATAVSCQKTHSTIRWECNSYPPKRAKVMSSIWTNRVIISSYPASPRRITVLKFSSNSLDFFGWNLLKSWPFLYRRRREKLFSDLQNFSTRNSPSVFPYLVKLNDNGSYHGLREPIRNLENHYPELKIY